MNESIIKTIEALKKNNMNAFYAETKEEAVKKVEELLTHGATVTFGGSMSLKEAGVIDLIKNGNYNLLDRASITDEKSRKEFFSKAYVADYFLSSSNAVTEDGILYNVDGNANRISMIVHGPDKVIMVVGKNKIVKTLDDAVYRVKTVAAPKNCVRLGIDTYCAKMGKCVSLIKENSKIYDGCNRICCDYLISAKQRVEGRINIIIVNEDLGY